MLKNPTTNQSYFVEMKEKNDIVVFELYDPRDNMTKDQIAKQKFVTMGDKDQSSLLGKMFERSTGLHKKPKRQI